MAEQHRATAEQWALVRRMAHHAEFSTILELRNRIEALEREAAMNELRAASAEARPTVKARITRDRDETGDYLIIHDASPNHSEKPDSSLVERVTAAIIAESGNLVDWEPEARAAIREVAAWLSDQERYVLDWVAVTLEEEAKH